MVVAKRALATGVDPPPRKKKGKYACKEDRTACLPISCVNVKLNSIWNPEFVALEPTFHAFVDALDGVVLNWNKIALEAWLFANYHMLRLVREGIPLPKLDQSFFEACCRVVTEGSRERKEEDIRISFDRYRAMRPAADYQPPSNALFSALIGNLRRQMEVNAKNHVVCNFVSRLIRYLRSRYAISRKEAWAMLKGAFDNKDPSESQLWLKGWLVYNPLNDKVLKAKVDHFFRLTYDMLVYQESLDPMTKGRKTFTLLPISGSYILSHAVLDRTTLREVLQHLPEEHRRIIAQHMTKGGELVRSSLAKAQFHFSKAMFQDLGLSEEIWRFIFRVESLETCNRRFDFGLSTNGYDVSLRFRVAIRTEGMERQCSPDEFDRFVGIDPGRTFIATGYATTEETADPELVQVSLKEYRHLSKMNEGRKWEKRLRAREVQYEAIIQCMPTMKRTDVDDAIRYRLGVADWMFRFCREKAFLKWRFKVKIYSRKTMAEVARRLTGGKRGGRTVVGLGDWSQQDGFLKGTPKAPIKRMKEELKKRAVVLDIDEYRTSKTCSVCCGLDSMKKVRVYVKKKGEDEKSLVKCHQIVRCRSTDCTKCWQRDNNAARNIHGLLWGELCGAERPSAMNRSTNFAGNTSDKSAKPAKLQGSIQVESRMRK
jgi:hypothetical protein